MDEELIKKQIKANRFKILMDVILIIILLGIFIYVFYNIESFKILGSDICKLCMEKTGANCIKLNP